MNYSGKLVGITGVEGFIGHALAVRLQKLGANVYEFEGDIRDPKTFEDLDHTFSYLFHFAAPSSQVLFKRKPAYCMETTVRGFMNAAIAAEHAGVRLIYPSTGLLSQNRSNEYARCKQFCEDWAKGNSLLDALGLRIFATYGPGESHKADYASVPYLFARDLVAGRQPTVFGDGNQVRDFIYIDDTVEAILRLAEECADPIVDVGSGKHISFNDILSEIQNNVKDREWPGVRYTEAPAGYVEETLAKTERLHDFYKPQVLLADGIRMMVNEIYRVEN